MSKESDDDVDEAVESSPSEVKDPSNPVVLDKYKKAALIAHSCITHLTSLAVPDALPLALCTAGDAFVEAELKKTHSRDKKLDKGLAFPTCVSVNHTVGHHSPLAGAPSPPLKAGDVVKLDVAVHIDGFVAAVAHTVTVPPLTPSPRVADLFSALSTAHDAVLRLLRPGLRSAAVTDIVARVCRDFHVQAVQGVLSHSLDRFVLDGPRVILNRAPGSGGTASGDERKDDSRVEDFEFKVNDVFAIDIILSTGEVSQAHIDTYTRAWDAQGRSGDDQRSYDSDDSTSYYYVNHLSSSPYLPLSLSPLHIRSPAAADRSPAAAVCASAAWGQGKPKPLDDCTIYKRNTQSSYQLKMQVSRRILSEIDRRSPVFPFTLRAFDESKAKFAIKEAKQHDLVYAYPVMVERDADLVAQCKFVVHITDRGAVKLSGLPVDSAGKSEHKVTDDDVKRLLNQGVLLPAAASSGAEKKEGTTGGGGGAGGETAAERAKKKKAAKKRAKKAEAGAAGEAAGKADDTAAAANDGDEDGGGE